MKHTTSTAQWIANKLPKIVVYWVLVRVAGWNNSGLTLKEAIRKVGRDLDGSRKNYSEVEDYSSSEQVQAEDEISSSPLWHEADSPGRFHL